MQRALRPLAVATLILLALVACAPTGGAPATVGKALAPAASVATAAFSPDASLLAVANPDRSITIWDVATGTARRTLTGQTGDIKALSFSADGKSLASGGTDRQVILWDATSGKEVRTLGTHNGDVNAVTFSPDGSTVASGGQDGTVRLWDVSSGTQRRMLEASPDGISSVVYSPDGLSLASGGRDATVQVWEASTGNLSRKLTGHRDAISALAFSRDSQRLATGGADKQVKLWSVRDGQEQRTLSGHTGAIDSLSFSPDGGSLASGSDDRTIKLWDTGSGQVRQTLTGHDAAIPAVAFSPDGRTLLSGGSDSSAKQWDPATGQLRRSIALARGPARPATPVTVDPGAIIPGLSAVQITVSQAKPQAELTFAGTEGRRVSVAIDNQTVPEADLTLQGPDGATLRSVYLFQATGFLDATELPTTGTYTLTLTARSGGGSARLTGYTFVDTTASIAPDGPAVSVSVSVPGQNARLTFQGKAGQGISAVVNGLTAPEGDLELIGPDGATIGSIYLFQPEQFFDTRQLPLDGTYTLDFDPRGTALGGATITAYSVTDATGTITPGGSGVPVTTSGIGQNARLTFEGKAGQRIAIGVTAFTAKEADLVLFDPDGVVVGSIYMFQPEHFFDARDLTVDGTYSIVFDPRGTEMGGATITAYSVTDRREQISIGGPAVPVTIDTPGQNAYLTFSADRARTVTVTLDALTIKEGDISIIAQDGSVLRISYFFQNGQTLEVPLPDAGTYTLLFSPRDAHTGGANITLK